MFFITVFSLSKNQRFFFKGDTLNNKLHKVKYPDRRFPKLNYSIQVTHKDENNIEFFIHWGGADGDITVKYKKGIGLVETSGSFSAGSKLVKFEPARINL